MMKCGIVSYIKPIRARLVDLEKKSLTKLRVFFKFIIKQFLLQDVT